MGQVTRYSEPQLKQALARRLGNMELATRIARAGVGEIARTHAYGATLVVESVAAAQRMVEQAEPLTPSQQGQFYSRTQVYLRDMLQITDHTAAQIVAQLNQR